MSTVGTINIDTRMHIAPIEQGAAKVSAAISGMAKGVSASLGSLKSLGSSLTRSIVPVVDVGSVISGIKGIVTAQSTFIDNQAKLADRLGITTESLVGLGHASDLAGVSTEELGDMLEKLQKNLGADAEDGGKMAASLAKLGLNAEKLKSQSIDETFMQIADVVSGIGDPLKRSAVMLELFGKSGQKLTNTMLAGRAGIRESVEEAKRLGMTFSRVDAAKVEAANDAFTRLKGAIAGVGNIITIGLAPFIEAATKSLTAFIATAGKDFGTIVVNAFVAAVDGAQLFYAALLRVGAKLGEIMADLGLMMNQVGNSGLAKMMGLGGMRQAGIATAEAGNAMALRMRVAANTADAAPRWSTGIQSAADEAAKSAAASVAVKGPSFADRIFGTIDTWTAKGRTIGEAVAKGVLDAAKAAQSKWTEIGKNITESVQTPLEKWQAKQNEIDVALRGGHITPEVAARATLANQDALKGAVGGDQGTVLSAPPSAAEFGTSSALNAIAQHRMQQSGSGGGNKSLPDLIKIARQQEQEQKRAANIAEQQLAIWKALKVIGI